MEKETEQEGARQRARARERERERERSPNGALSPVVLLKVHILVMFTPCRHTRQETLRVLGLNMCIWDGVM